jgi:putative SOS response-associated peptidase YedK
LAPIVRNIGGERELAMVRWEMPTAQNALLEATKKRAAKLEAKRKTVDFSELLRMEPDGGVTNIRNLKSRHWTRWTGIDHRCIVPFTSFSEFNKDYGGNVWFALDERAVRLFRRALERRMDVGAQGQGRRDHQ